eukprot:CAMPEP_0117556828 /NCGR_PEP_ID=MMETSP0784-20121206/52011_1 /TAXON_ID=39447 /ORGANISM="" /LENGTH=193 /DNA_ID=CAMNT_0005354117 /DNA_START=70 /DNA_END=652 /DNA_ORIENTATION=-
MPTKRASSAYTYATGASDISYQSSGTRSARSGHRSNESRSSRPSSGSRLERASRSTASLSGSGICKTALNALPGYSGYVPGVAAENVFGHTFVRANKIAGKEIKTNRGNKEEYPGKRSPARGGSPRSPGGFESNANTTYSNGEASMQGIDRVVHAARRKGELGSHQGRPAAKPQPSVGPIGATGLDYSQIHAG